jgi:MFS family permease
MFGWYATLDPVKKRTFWACYGGFALDSLNVMVFTFVIPTLFVLWHMTPGQAGLIATVTLLLSAFGGWAAGFLSDRIGRVRVLQITILWYAIFTFLCGFTQSPDQLLVMRGLQGLGFGGEWAAGSVLMGEVIATRYRGRAVGFVQSSWAVGWAAAAICASIVYKILPPEWAWRSLFFIGILPGLFVLFIRRAVPEPEIFLTETSRTGKVSSPFAIFAPGLLSLTLRGALLAIGAQGGYYAITTWLPTFLRTERHLTILGSNGYLGVIIFGSLCGYVASAILTDIIGRRPNFLLFAVGSAVIVLLYTQLPVSNHVMLGLGFPLGFFASGIFSGMGAFYTELFPTAVRATAQGFCYNSGRGLAAFFPALVGYLTKSLTLGVAIGLFAACAYGLVVIAALLLPETKGRSLGEIPLGHGAGSGAAQ